MTRSYFNATKVLPGHLLRELQKYCPGQQIYIPKPNKAAQRRARVLAFAADGMPTREIARRVRLTQRHVRRLIAWDRKSHAQVQKNLTSRQ